LTDDIDAAVRSWLTRLAAELEVDPATLDHVPALLDLARDAAHCVGRPAAPLSTFLVGLATGAAAAKAANGSGPDLEDAIATARRLATEAGTS
jgi:hypothetical protein